MSNIHIYRIELISANSSDPNRWSTSLGFVCDSVAAKVTSDTECGSFGNGNSIQYFTRTATDTTNATLYDNSGKLVGSTAPIKGVGTIIRMTVNLNKGEVEYYDETAGRVLMKVEGAEPLKTGKWWFTLRFNDGSHSPGCAWELK